MISSLNYLQLSLFHAALKLLCWLTDVLLASLFTLILNLGTETQGRLYSAGLRGELSGRTRWLYFHNPLDLSHIFIR